MERFLVSAATGAMGSLLKKLGTMLSDEYKLLKGVRDDIKFLKDELEAMQAFLLVMADVEEPDHQAKLRVNAIRELSYDIDDKVDKFMLLVDHETGSNSEGFKEIFDKCMKKITNIKTRHKIAKNVKDIKSQITELSERYGRYKIDESCRPRNEKVDPRLHAIYKDASELVGINGPRDELLKWFSDKEGESALQPKVVSVVGYGGLGKTTLARQVYDKLGANYECRAFVSISRSPDMAKILSSLLSQLCKQDYAHYGAGDLQLIIDLIRDFLKDKSHCASLERNEKVMFLKSFIFATEPVRQQTKKPSETLMSTGPGSHRRIPAQCSICIQTNTTNLYYCDSTNMEEKTHYFFPKDQTLCK